jgi:hypothetical protein
MIYEVSTYFRVFSTHPPGASTAWRSAPEQNADVKMSNCAKSTSTIPPTVLKDLNRLLKHLPDSIPIGNEHDFFGFAPNGKAADQLGCLMSVVSHALGKSLGLRRSPAGDDITVTFKSRGPALEEVVTVLRNYITGSGGSHRDGVDITAPFFRDLLADKAIPGANDIRSLENWAERAAGSAQSQSGKNAAGKSMWQGEVDTLEF